jgi:hypothetical protein
MQFLLIFIFAIMWTSSAAQQTSFSFLALLDYNQKRRNELKISDASSGSGISYGLMIGVKAIETGYARSSYHVAGASNAIYLTNRLIESRS